MIWLLIVCNIVDMRGACLPAQRFETKRMCEFVAQRYRYTSVFSKDVPYSSVRTTCTGIPGNGEKHGG